MKRRFAATAASIAMVFTFTACTGEKEAAPAPTVTVTAEPTPEPTPTEPDVDALFTDLIREYTDAFDTSSDEDIIAAAKAVCGMWDSGATIDDVVNMIIESGVDPEDGGFLAGAGTEAYCPEHSDKVSGSTT